MHNRSQCFLWPHFCSLLSKALGNRNPGSGAAPQTESPVLPEVTVNFFLLSLLVEICFISNADRKARAPGMLILTIDYVLRYVKMEQLL